MWHICGRKYGAPGEDRSHYTDIFVLEKQACLATTPLQDAHFLIIYNLLSSLQPNSVSDVSSSLVFSRNENGMVFLLSEVMPGSNAYELTYKLTEE